MADWDTHPDAGDVVMPTQAEMLASASNRDWPWVDCPLKLVSQAPFSINEYRPRTQQYFTLPRVEQLSFRCFAGLEDSILRELFKQHLPVANLAATCQQMYFRCHQWVDHWDVTRAGFNGCDTIQEIEQDGIKPSPEFTVGKIVIVSPFRNRAVKGENFEGELYNLQHLVMSISNYPDRFETLHLHRVPLLTTNVLALVIPYLRNLKHLGIFQCGMIHVGETARLLEIVHPSKRLTGQTQHIDLDFFPRWHQGPNPDTCDPKLYGGTYGATWDNCRFDNRLGIAKIMLDVLPQAKKQGIDFISKDSAFRLWLDKSPIWRVQALIDVIMKHCDDARATTLGLAANVEIATIAAYHYTNGKEKTLRSMGSGACIDVHTCDRCHKPALGIWYDIDEWMENFVYQMNPRGKVRVVHRTRDPDAPGGYRFREETQIHTHPQYDMICIGCQLQKYLQQERDHFKQEKIYLSDFWLTTTKLPITVLPEDGVNPFVPAQPNTTNVTPPPAATNPPAAAPDTEPIKPIVEIETEDLSLICKLDHRIAARKVARKMDRKREKFWAAYDIGPHDVVAQQILVDRQQGRRAAGFGNHAATVDSARRKDSIW